jgi:hypothetical protein
MKIHVSIDRLVLDGFAFTAKERERVRASVEVELSRLIRAGGASPSMRSGGAVESIAAPPIQRQNGAAQTGESIARSVFRGIGGT